MNTEQIRRRNLFQFNNPTNIRERSIQGSSNETPFQLFKNLWAIFKQFICMRKKTHLTKKLKGGIQIDVTI